ncbi:ankyrin repeat protein [Legionella sainthelensi]|uniref:Ankyrin repeat protein n=1 Tax=Legionella sainthelensi TaxID=28087 RepID=A0A0W0YV44_9GAMM|nr:ankyrin repeat domain-containing protein [Legionella sainthelensi]KTD60406.1 ankyrin repeat protein [Legionella sainthelensi]VEH34905.1 ankyrin repeat protein [Legionella sainthelensi]
MPYEDLKNELTPMSAKKKDKAWIAIACSHPEMENQKLIEIGEKLGLNASEMLNFVVMLGDSPKHLALLEHLFRQEDYSDWFFKHSSLRIQRAIQCGHLNTLMYLAGTFNSYKNIFRGLIDSFANVRLGLKDYLMGIIQSMMPSSRVYRVIAEYDFAVFRYAARYGNLDFLKYQVKQLSGKLQDVITAEEFGAFLDAAKNGHLDVLLYLEEKAPDRLQDMIAVDNFNAFKWAASYREHSMIHYLLNNPKTFAYDETSHHRVFECYIEPFVVQKMTALRIQQQQAKINNIDIIFDVIDPNEAKLLFYIARNLIRRNDQGLSDDLCFLLDIPAVKALAHDEVTPDQSNELLCLALFVAIPSIYK